MRRCPGRLTACVLAIVAFGAGAARANQWWVNYEGNDWPENERWDRYTAGGGAQRYVSDSTLVLDGLASIDIVDAYRATIPSLPDTGETFRAEWRLRVDQVSSLFDPGVGISFAGYGDVYLAFTYDRIFNLSEGEWVANFAPGVFHEYVLMTSDMSQYTLYIDGALAHIGAIAPAAPDSWVEWGDCARGGASLTTWDYYRFGNVPEPTTGLMLGSWGLALTLRTRRSWRSTARKREKTRDSRLLFITK